MLLQSVVTQEDLVTAVVTGITMGTPETIAATKEVLITAVVTGITMGTPEIPALLILIRETVTDAETPGSLFTRVTGKF